MKFVKNIHPVTGNFKFSRLEVKGQGHSQAKCTFPVEGYQSTRGVRVYPYPRVYPTRPVPAGTGRVRVDVLRVGSGTGTTSTGTGIPYFTRKKPDFSRFWSFVYCSF